MGKRRVSEYGCFGVFFGWFMVVFGVLCTGYLSIAFSSSREFQRDRQEMQSKQDAVEEYERIKAIEEGPERDARLEAWKRKYPVRFRRILGRNEAGVTGKSEHDMAK